MSYVIGKHHYSLNFSKCHCACRFEISGYNSLPYPSEFFLSLLLVSVRADEYVDVITKFSGIDGFPFSIGMELHCGRSAMSKPSQVAVRWPSRDSRRPSQSEFLKIQLDLYTSLQQVLCCAYCDLGSRRRDTQDQVKGFQYLSGA